MAAVAAALGALLLAPGLPQPHRERPPQGSGQEEQPGPGPVRRSPVRMDQALLLVHNELPGPGLRLAARSGACHQVSGATARGSLSAWDSRGAGLCWRFPVASFGCFSCVFMQLLLQHLHIFP